MKFKKSIALVLAAITMAGVVSGCKNGTEQQDGKINVSIGNWPDETRPEELKNMNLMRDEFMARYDNINIIPDTYQFNIDTFAMKAIAGQLPSMSSIFFTEIQGNIKNGYAADITDALKKRGFDTAINPNLLNLVKDEEGRIYGVPTDAYAQGLYINKKLFREAGLVNEDGSVMVPDTYEDVAKYAKQIKDKTGKAGFVLPLQGGSGGWIFLNIAWSFGVEFEKQREDGTWEATFNTQEARDALQFVKDLRWKYDVLPPATVIDGAEVHQYFGTHQAAMMIADPPCNALTQRYGMAIEDIMVTKMAAGPAGRYTQMGGNLKLFAPDSTEEEIEACLDWLEFTGISPELDETQEKNLRRDCENTLENNGIVLDRRAFPIWVNQDRVEKEQAILKEYANVNSEDYEGYYAFEGVTINPEPSACAQQLYVILTDCMQEVVTNKDADVAKLIETACEDFQVNHLDKM